MSIGVTGISVFCFIIVVLAFVNVYLVSVTNKAISNKKDAKKCLKKLRKAYAKLEAENAQLKSLLSKIEQDANIEGDIDIILDSLESDIEPAELSLPKPKSFKEVK